MTSEARVSELTDIFKNLADTAGGYEHTRIMPNLEVIDAAPANLPANFIIIKDDEGFYIPALTVAGMTYTNGDLVNVLFIKGAEPIAFQHGSSGSGGYAVHISDEGVDQGNASTLDFVGANVSVAVAAGVATITVLAGGGWPFAHVLTVSTTDPDADYPDIPAAIAAAAASGDNIELDPDTYIAPNVAGGITVDESMSIVGKSPQETIITRADNSSVTVTVADTPVTLRNITLAHTGAGAGTSTPLSNNQASLVLDNCYLLKSGASGNSIGLSQGGGDSLLRNCKISATNGTILNYAVYLHTAASTCVLDGGEVSAGTLATGHASAVIELRGVRLASGVTLDVSGGGTIRGWYIDAYGRIVRIKPIGINNVRLTLTTGTPVTTADVTAAATIYATPYKGNTIEVYTGSGWVEAPFTELSLSLSGFTASKNSDLFVYDNAGTLALERTEWTNDTTRATALVVQDGRYVKSGATTRLYLGTFRTTATTGQCEDSAAYRYVWNYYNRKNRGCRRYYANGHTYDTASFRDWDNNNTTSRAYFVVGVVEDFIDVFVYGTCTMVAAGSVPHIGVSVNTTAVLDIAMGIPGTLWFGGNRPDLTPGLGYNYLQPIEYGTATGADPTFWEVQVQTMLRG